MRVCHLIHELGHCLGLPHNFTGGPEGDECDRCDDNGCFPAGTTNNIMDYWPNFGHALSECQVAVVDTFLTGFRGNISEAVINDSCYLVSGKALFLNSGDTLIIPLMPGDHSFVVCGMEQPPVFRNWQAW